MRRFEEMATIVNDRIDDPSEAGVDRYVGLEHLDSDSLTIRRWGSPHDVQATKLRFRSGDIIFGRRRAYQRKLAVADFDGICSAHAMVLRARPEVALSGFLPFFMQSDAFMERAMEISVGSLSPTINWKTLAKEQFCMPPLDEQARMVGLLRSITAAEEAMLRAAHAALEVQRALMVRNFAPGAAPFAFRQLQDLAIRINDGTHQPPKFSNSGIPFLLVSNIAGGRIDWATEKYVSRDVFEDLSRTWRPQQNDVLYSLVGTYGVPALVDRELAFTFQRHIGLIRPDPRKLLPRFLYWYLRSPAGRQQADLQAEGLAQKTITLGALRCFAIPTPTLTRQRQIVAEMDMSELAVGSLEDRARSLRRVEIGVMATGSEGLP